MHTRIYAFLVIGTILFIIGSCDSLLNQSNDSVSLPFNGTTPLPSLETEDYKTGNSIKGDPLSAENSKINWSKIKPLLAPQKSPRPDRKPPCGLLQCQRFERGEVLLPDVASGFF